MTTILPAVPAGRLAPVGHAIPAAELRDRLAALGNEDPEAGHGAVDDLMHAVLEAIRDGHPDPAGLAEAALVVISAKFPRWSA